MAVFLIVFFISVLLYADAFKSIEQIMQLNGTVEAVAVAADASFYTKYCSQYVKDWQKSFFASIAEFDPLGLDDWDENGFFVFFTCCIFNIIVMLNMLISIVNANYEEVSGAKDQILYREKVRLISMMQDTVFGQKKN